MTDYTTQPLSDEETAEKFGHIADAYRTSYRDDTLPSTPTIGDAPPVQQPGRTAMSEKATDDSVRMICAGFLTLCAGGATAVVLHFSSEADPTVIGLMAATPVGLAIPVLALSRLVRRVKETVEAAPPEHHHHYNGDVHQENVHTSTENHGVWVKSSTNQ